MAAECDQERGRDDDVMVRDTIRVPPVLMEALEEYAGDRGYANKSEAHREAIRQFVPDDYFPIRENGGER